MRPRWRSLVAVVALAAAVLVGPHATAASAHAGLVSSTPEPATGLPQAPGAVVLRFGEPLNLRLSRVEVTGPGGEDAAAGPTVAVEGDPRAMRRTLGLLAPGQYRVRWTTVSTLDGHTLHGSFGFAIGSEVGAPEALRATPISSEGPLGLLGRLVALAGLTTWAGWTALRRKAVRTGISPSHVRRLGVVAPALVLVGTAASVASTALVAGGSLGGVGDVLGSGRSGSARAVLLAAAALGVAVGRLPGVGVALASVAVVAEAASGHAASNPWPLVATVSFSLHLAAVGVWLFAIAAALLAPRTAVALAAFTPAAVGAAAVVAATGLANATLQLSEPGELFSTGYGWALLAKAAVLTAMVVFGMVHLRARADGALVDSAVRFPLRLEAGAAVMGLVVATVLVGFPNPPREVAAAERREEPERALARLAGKEALSVAEASGPFVVGLSVVPPAPGPVEVRLQVLGVEAGDGLRDARVVGHLDATSQGFETALRACGTGCFAGEATIPGEGRWRLEATVGSNRGRIAVATEVLLPAPVADGEFARAIDAMQALSSVRMEERLQASTDGAVVVSRYRYRAPNAFAFEVNDSSQITIGDTNYRREAENGTWKASDGGIPFRWPGSSFRQFWGRGVAVRLLGTEEVDGVSSRVVGFVRPDLPAWFRISVGVDDGLVRREVMLAEGHLMEHRYRDFNAPLDLRPPL